MVCSRWASGPGQRRGETYDLTTECEEAADRWAAEAGGLAAAAGRLGPWPLPSDDADTLLFAAGRDRLLNAGHVYRADRLYRGTPRRTAWRLLLAFGRAVRASSPPQKQADRMLGFYRIVNDFCQPDRKGR